MEKKMKKLAVQIEALTKDGRETDLTVLSKETGLLQRELEGILLEMDAKNWVSVYEIDLCCGAEYVIHGLTEEGRQAMLKERA